MTDQRSTDFNLFFAAGTLFGILDALFDMSSDIPETEPELTHFHAKLSGLARQGCLLARELHDFLNEASEQHRFPYKYSQLGQTRMVKEPPALYMASSR